MKIRLHGRRVAAEPGGAQGTAEPTAVTWARAQLQERIQRAGAALAPNAQSTDRQTREMDRSPLADSEAEP